jgi:hypothetical protein
VGEEANFSQFRPGSVDRLKIAEDPPSTVTGSGSGKGLAGAVRVVVWDSETCSINVVNGVGSRVFWCFPGTSAALVTTSPSQDAASLSLQCLLIYLQQSRPLSPGVCMFELHSAAPNQKALSRSFPFSASHQTRVRRGRCCVTEEPSVRFLACTLSQKLILRMSRK